MWERLQVAVMILKVEGGVAVVALLLSYILYVHVMCSFSASYYI